MITRSHPASIDTTNPHYICVPQRDAAGCLTGKWRVIDPDGAEVFIGDESDAFKQRDHLNQPTAPVTK